jgi:hypothetical protein
MFAAILACGKIPFRTPSGRLDTDGVQLQFSPVFFISVEHHVGFLLQIKEICSHHSLQQRPRTSDWATLTCAGRQQRELLLGGLQQHTAIPSHCNKLSLNARQDLNGTERGIVAV